MRNLIRGMGMAALAGFFGGMLFIPGWNVVASGVHAILGENFANSWHLILGLCMVLASAFFPIASLCGLTTREFRCKKCNSKNFFAVCKHCGTPNILNAIENISSYALTAASIACIFGGLLPLIKLHSEIKKLLM